MKKLMMIVCAGLVLGACASKKEALRKADYLIEQSKTADCTTIRSYLQVIQDEIRKQLR